MKNSILFAVIILILVSPAFASPVITVPSDIVAEAESGSGTSPVEFAVSAANESWPVPVSCDHKPRDTFPLGTTTVTCTATDSEGDAQAFFNVIVQDTTPPVFDTTPENIAEEAKSPIGNMIFYDLPPATDLVDGVTGVQCSPPSNIIEFHIGTTPVICTATDMHGNTATTGFNVIIQDTTPPETTDNAPEERQNTSVDVVLTPNDDGSDVASTVYCVDQTNTCTPSTPGTSVIVSGDGISYVRYESADARGNNESVKFTTINIDRTRPAEQPKIPTPQQPEPQTRQITTPIIGAATGITGFITANPAVAGGAVIVVVIVLYLVFRMKGKGKVKKE